MPADLAAVQADDALLDLISRPGYCPSDNHDELTRMLAGWRQEIDDEPFTELVDTDTALAAIRAGRRPVRRRNPVFGSIAAAAAVLVIAFSSVGLVAKSAQPGDRLWGVTQVLYGDYARSVETAATVRTELNDARTALNHGDPERARASLQRVQNQLPAISESEGRNDLTASHRQLEQMLNGSPADGSATPPPWAPGFSPPGIPSGRPRSGASASTEVTASTDATTAPDSTTESPDSVTSPGPDRLHPGPGYPRPGYPVPSPTGSPSAGTTTDDHTSGDGAGGPTSGSTIGKDFTGGNAADKPGNGPANNLGTPPHRRDHMHGVPPGSGPPGAGTAPGCDQVGQGRYPYCR